MNKSTITLNKQAIKDLKEGQEIYYITKDKKELIKISLDNKAFCFLNNYSEDRNLTNNLNKEVRG